MAIFLIIVCIVLEFILAKVFANIASDKGYDGKLYFWLSFLFSVIGYGAVIALPDLHVRTIQQEILNEMKKQREQKEKEKALEKDVKNQDRPEELVANTQVRTNIGGHAGPAITKKEPWKCPACGTTNEMTRLLCRSCGHKR